MNGLGLRTQKTIYASKLLLLCSISNENDGETSSDMPQFSFIGCVGHLALLVP